MRRTRRVGETQHILSLRLGIEICEGDRRAAFFHGQLLQHIDAEAAHPLNLFIHLFFAGSLENEGENAVAVAGEKAGKRVDLSLVRLDEIDGKVAEMAGHLAGTNGDRLPVILAGELNVGRFLDVREAERSPRSANVVDILYDPRDPVHRLITLRQFGGRTGHYKSENYDKAAQQFHSTLHGKTFPQPVKRYVSEVLEWRGHRFIPAFSTLRPSGVIIA